MGSDVEKYCDCKDRTQCWEPCGDLGKSEAHAKVVDAERVKPVESVVMRLEKLRLELFDAIDYAIKMDGHHKSYEGKLAMVWPHRFTDEYAIELSCYVIGPSRHYSWGGKSFDEALTKAEKDIREWIKEEYENDYDE